MTGRATALRRARLTLPALAATVLAACATSGPVVGNEGVGARAGAGNVRAAAGPDDAAVGYSGERVVAGVGTDHRAAAGVRLDDGSPAVVGVGTPSGGGLFGGMAFGF
jgi:hypothetical protein